MSLIYLPFTDTILDWNYTVVPQVGLNNRDFPYPRGRLLGGSSSVSKCQVIGTDITLLLLISLITRLSIPPIWLDGGLGQIRSCYRRSGMGMEQHETIRIKGIYYDISLSILRFLLTRYG
jgi:hypothetical protein